MDIHSITDREKEKERERGKEREREGERGREREGERGREREVQNRSRWRKERDCSSTQMFLTMCYPRPLFRLF